MAHMIEKVGGVYQHAYAGETPWHGLGKQVPADLGADQFMQAAGLDWEVELTPSMYEWNGELKSNGTQTLVRRGKGELDGTMLGVVTDNWHPVQNATAFEFFHEFIQQGNMEMHTAGSLNGGKLVWALARIKQEFSVFRDDVIHPYLLFTNPHQYGKSIDIRFTPIRVVCNNTLTLSLNMKNEKNNMTVTLNHRKAFDPEIVKSALKIASLKLDRYRTVAEYLGSKKAERLDIVAYFKEVLPHMSAKKDDPNIMSRGASMALDILEKQPGAKFAQGSWWQPFNALTFVLDHGLGGSNEARMVSSWYGNGRGVKTKALELATHYADKSGSALVAA